MGACYGAVSTGIALERALEEVVAMADIALGTVQMTRAGNGGGQVPKNTDGTGGLGSKGEGNYPFERGNYSKAKDNYLKQKGIDAHELKKDFLGRKASIAEYDIYINKDTGELFIFKKGGKGVGIPTGEFIK